jgi:hypothetical protein
MERSEPQRQERKPLKKSVMGLQKRVRDRGSFVRELQRAARDRLDKRSPKR